MYNTWRLLWRLSLTPCVLSLPLRLRIKTGYEPRGRGRDGVLMVFRRGLTLGAETILSLTFLLSYSWQKSKRSTSMRLCSRVLRQHVVLFVSAVRLYVRLMSNSINLFTPLRAKYKVIAEKYHTTRRITFLVMSEAILASIAIFDDERRMYLRQTIMDVYFLLKVLEMCASQVIL
jgi:hypothetical protein